jgi:hypothetical protein
LQHDGGYAGGNWNNTSNAGLGYRNANNERSNANNNLGFRSALPYCGQCLHAGRPLLKGNGPRNGKGIAVLAGPKKLFAQGDKYRKGKPPKRFSLFSVFHKEE